MHVLFLLTLVSTNNFNLNFRKRISNRGTVLKGLFLGSRCDNSVAMPVYKVEAEGHLNGLAKQFERNESCMALRRNALKTGKVCFWPSPKHTGVMTLPNVSLNAEAMKVIISIWCPQSETPKTIPLEDAKYQARKRCFLRVFHPFLGCCSNAPLSLLTEVLRFRKKMQMNTAVSKVHVDATGLRGLFTYMLRRHDGSKRRVPQINGISFILSRKNLLCH